MTETFWQVCTNNTPHVDVSVTVENTAPLLLQVCGLRKTTCIRSRKVPNREILGAKHFIKLIGKTFFHSLKRKSLIVTCSTHKLLEHSPVLKNLTVLCHLHLHDHSQKLININNQLIISFTIQIHLLSISKPMC